MLKKPHKLRVVLLGGTFFVLAGVVAGRLFDLQVARHEDYLERAVSRQVQDFVLHAERGDILDRRGRLLATSVGTLSVYVWPKYFQEPEAEVDLHLLAGQVSYYTGLPSREILRKLQGEPITHVGRQLDPEVAQGVAELFANYGVSRRGFWFERESKRRYPRHLAPHIIGFTGTDGAGDNIGRAGVELVYDEQIKGQRIEGRTSRTGIRQAMEPIPQEFLLDARGHTIVLTIDGALQEAAENAVARAAAEFDADAAGAVVQDVETGAILAMASWPTFDNAQFSQAPTEARRDRNLTDPMETGSVAKLFTAGLLLDTGKVRLDSMINCEGGRAVIGPRLIRDSPGHYLGTVPFYEVIRHSSNVGTIKAAQLLDNQEWYDYLRAFGLGAPTGIDLPGEGAGILRTPDKWNSYSRTSLPMGYEMALTPIQIVNGVTGLVNGGELLEPFVVSEVRDSRGNVVWRRERTVRHRMIRPATSFMMRQVMEDVVLNGTGKKAQVEGFRVGGKTGTTRKSHVLTHREYIASFAGALPIDRPRIAIYCFVDNPKGKYYATDVAAPVFKEIAQAAVLQLGLIPARSEEADGRRVAAAQPQLPVIRQIEAPAPTEIDHGLMPNLAGLTMSEVRGELPGFVEHVRFVGSGRVADQSPAPGAVLEPSAEIVVVFQPDAPRPVAQAASHVAAGARSARP